MRKFPIVLVIDDSKAFRVFCKDIIKKTVKWVRVTEAVDGIQGLRMYLRHKPDLILLDYKMPNLDGLQVLKSIRKNDHDTKIIMNSAWVDDQITINEIIKSGANNFVPKPMNRTILMKAVTDALHQGKIAGNSNRISKSSVLNCNYN